MPLINCKVTLHLVWLESWIIREEDRATAFAMTHAKLYALVVTLSTKDNAKLLQQLK